MKKLILSLILPIIGFSQDCENPILSEAVTNTQVNQYFQLALTLNSSQLDFLNDCNTDISYTMFVPGNDIPNESAGQLLGLSGELMDYIPYYIHIGEVFVEGWGDTITMMDGNTAELSLEESGVCINGVTISTPICACNGIMYIINDLIWAPGVINLDEINNPAQIQYNPSKSKLKISNVQKNGILNIIDLNGRNILKKEIKNAIEIDIDICNPGFYIAQFQSENESFSQIILMN
tara:strand:- start:47 stop:751 length:705 start_codon:yes stop_codon:yes gene_type:complete